jgi:hypothetical protein
MLAMKAPLLTAVALLVAAALAPQAHAYSRGVAVKTIKLDARISGTQAIGWHYQSDGWPADDAPWTLGAGSQTLEFATSKAFPMQLLDARVPGHHQVILSSVATRQPRLSGAVSREKGWDHHVPKLCGGELGDCSTLQAPPEPVFDCAQRQVTVSMTTLEGELDKDSGGVRLVLTASSAHPFPSCPPDQPDGGAVPGLQATSMGPIALDRKVTDIAKLRKGKTITLTGTLQRGLSPSMSFKTSCPRLAGPGYTQCETTKVTVQLKRRA